MSGTWKDRKRYFHKELWYETDTYNNTCYLGSISSEFKRIQRRKRRAKVKNALRNNNYDVLPRFRKEDAWNWY